MLSAPLNRQADRSGGGGDGRLLGRSGHHAAKDGLDLYRDLRAARVYSTSLKQQQQQTSKQQQRSRRSAPVVSSRAEQIMELKRQLASTRQDLQFSKVST